MALFYRLRPLYYLIPPVVFTIPCRRGAPQLVEDPDNGRIEDPGFSREGGFFIAPSLLHPCFTFVIPAQAGIHFHYYIVSGLFEDPDYIRGPRFIEGVT
ncbi:MAG TPA: hypothetical protein ENH25_05035 [candidate division Zixibacteria bacterium]|nr:hypothetical protein [candidate division Zixibacteria bacterium]